MVVTGDVVFPIARNKPLHHGAGLDVLDGINAARVQRVGEVGTVCGDCRADGVYVVGERAHLAVAVDGVPIFYLVLRRQSFLCISPCAEQERQKQAKERHYSFFLIHDSFLLFL